MVDSGGWGSVVNGQNGACETYTHPERDRQ
jgi:hypothetical protein